MHAPERWITRIQRAQSEEDLVAIVREYLGTWLPSDLESLPREGRIAAISTGSEISVAAVTVAQLELRASHSEPWAESLRDMADVLVAAQMRLRQILGRKHDPSASDAC